MKRILLTVLAIFYLGIASGATVHFHYCMGKLVSWGFAKQSDKVCGFCGMPMAQAKKKSCCKDVEQQAKVEKAQKTSQAVYKFDQLSTAIVPTALFVNYQPVVAVKIVREALSNAPPDWQQVPVYIKNCTYII